MAEEEEESQLDEFSVGEDDGTSRQSRSVDIFGSDGGSQVGGQAEDEDGAEVGLDEDLDKSLYDPVPSLAAAYGEASFWDRRYMTMEETFEWYLDYEKLKPIITRYLDPEMNILQLGCGNSLLAAEMYDDGFTQIVNTDISRVVIDQMEEQFQEEYPDMQWKQTNCCDMVHLFEAKEFMAVIDKACLDAIYCADLGVKKVRKALQEVDRVLQSTGVYISVSYGRPEARLREIDCEDSEDPYFLAWKVEVVTLPKPTIDPFQVVDPRDLDMMYFVYICTKDPKMDKFKEDKALRKAGKLGKKGKRRVNNRQGK